MVFAEHQNFLMPLSLQGLFFLQKISYKTYKNLKNFDYFNLLKIK